MPGIDSFNPLLYSQSPAALEAAKKNKKEEEQKKTGASGGIKSRFSDLLRKAEEIPVTDPDLPMEIATMEFDDAVVFLMDGVTMAGEELKNSPLPEVFANYKQKIRQFLHFVAKNTYDVEIQQGIRSPRFRNRKPYTIINIVNEKLEQLAKDIIFLQSNQLSMLAKVEEIKGLLVDLLH